MAASRKSKKFWIWLSTGIFVIVVLAGLGLARLAKGASIDPNKLGKVTRGDVARSVVATGKIQPITQVEVKSKASGIVEKLYVDINNVVHKGQQLAQLDQQEIVAQVEAQRAQLASAEANVGTFEANIEQDKVNANAPDLPSFRSRIIFPVMFEDKLVSWTGRAISLDAFLRYKTLPADQEKAKAWGYQPSIWQLPIISYGMIIY